MPDEERQRIDKWLFFARVVKSRSLAAKLVQAGRVRVNRDKGRAGCASVKAGDVLTITLDRRVLVYRVAAPGARRGPAEEARLLYEDVSPPAPADRRRRPTPFTPLREQGSGRPTKKERRATDRASRRLKRQRVSWIFYGFGFSLDSRSPRTPDMAGCAALALAGKVATSPAFECQSQHGLPGAFP